jgi:hypothetical protein
MSGGWKLLAMRYGSGKLSESSINRYVYPSFTSHVLAFTYRVLRWKISSVTVFHLNIQNYMLYMKTIDIAG